MVIDSFLDYLRYERNYSGLTIDVYGRDISQFRDFIQERNISFIPAEVEPVQIREWIIHLMDNGYSPNSVNRKLSSLRTFYKFLMKRGVVDKDPLVKIAGPKKKKPLPSFLKESEINKLLDETEFEEGFAGIRDRLIIEMFYSTGIRRSELIGIKDEDVDFYTQQVKINGKRNKQRLIPFGDPLKKSLMEYITVRNQTVSSAPEAFFVSENGRPLSSQLIYNMVKRNLSKVVTLKKRSPHVLRHTFATVMLNNDADLSTVKELLGHSSLASTEVYTHTTFEELKKIYKQAHPRA